MIHSQASQFRKIYLIIDGLDECSDQTRLDLLNLANELLESHQCTRLIVSSRPVDGVGANLNNAVKLNMKANPEDIGLYIDECIKRMAGLQKVTKRFPELAREIKSELMEKASGMLVFLQRSSDLRTDNLQGFFYQSCTLRFSTRPSRRQRRVSG